MEITPLTWHINTFAQCMLDEQIQQGRYQVVRLSNDSDDYGLYVNGQRNTFGTTMVCRGTLEQVTDAIARL